MKLVRPAPNAIVRITRDPTWPSVVFQTDATGVHTWRWRIVWRRWSRAGTAITPDNSWDAQGAITNLGGTLTVRAEAANASATLSVRVRGINPDAADVNRFLATKPDSDGFDRILAQESHFRHFNANGEPIRSFDNGYGMCQLTTPAPTFEQVWSWQRNVEGGLALFAHKRASAIAFLSQGGRSYTADQLRYETVSRWNGGPYHEWDAARGQWVRRANILCDTHTGNIGWDMTKPENAGRTEAELHGRDAGDYSTRATQGTRWHYTGVCYADHVLG